MENQTSLHLEEKLPNRQLTLYTPKNDEIITKMIDEYEGKRLILFFYPADFTFVCPTELKDINKIYKEIQDSKAEILVASTDTVFSHKRRIETEKLLENFGINMISDRTGELSKILGVLNETSGNSERGTFIISPDGFIKSIEIVTEPIGRSSVELLRKIRALESVRANPGSACPASWNVGESILHPSIKIAGKIGEI
jgi:peroxiredoxin (alkyl hydroperoxide reductase subunit C)